ncbi:DNA-directed RNA polymerase subunit omega [uncultured Dokdonia sp.]|uniref:DNA-directed RNA polymerase subunit omega n=1 Tax=uncultured Dokdonia sp. TaxID=575653 RepID=UPI00261BB4EC|nr:DNA-directed RNA polymerase subunit omega [uncultured Dokdonia sp.]
MNIKDTDAPVNTTTIDKNLVDAPTDNVYEAISIIAKRATQINTEIKKELSDKLDEFATFNDSLEEIFENKEQIEVSKFYERLPKSHALAVQEWLEDRIYYRDTSVSEDDTNA